MNKPDISSISDIFSHSASPSFITDDAGCILWENNAFQAMLRSPEERQIFAMSAANAETNGCVVFGGKVFSVSIINYNGCRIVQSLRGDEISHIFASAGVRDYLTYAFARLRKYASSTSEAMDGIFSLLKGDGFEKAEDAARDIVALLNTIDGGVASVIALLCNPEQLVYLMDSSAAADTTVSVKTETDKVISAAEKSAFAAKYGVKFKKSLTSGLYAHISRSAYHIVISDAIAACMNMVNAPTVISVSTATAGMDKICVTVNSVSGKKPNADRSGNDIFSDYVCDAFCKRYGGSFTMNESGDGLSCSISFSALSDDAAKISAPLSFDDGDDLYAVFKSEDRYCLENN